MITRLSAAIVGLMAFSGMILSGLLAGNSFTTIILRALVGLFGGLAVGFGAGYVCKLLVYENFQEIVDADTQEEIQEAEMQARIERGEIDPAELEETEGDGLDGRDLTSTGPRGTTSARAAERVLNNQ